MSSDIYKSIQNHFEKVECNLTKIKQKFEQLKDKKENAESLKMKLKYKSEIDTINNVINQAGFEDFKEECIKFKILSNWINKTESVNNEMVFIGDYNKLNITTDDKHYTISSLAELKELKNDFTNTEIQNFTNFYLNN